MGHMVLSFTYSTTLSKDQGEAGRCWLHGMGEALAGEFICLHFTYGGSVAQWLSGVVFFSSFFSSSSSFVFFFLFWRTLFWIGIYWEPYFLNINTHPAPPHRPCPPTLSWGFVVTF